MSLPHIGCTWAPGPGMLPRSYLSHAVLLRDQSPRPAHTDGRGVPAPGGEAVGRWAALLLQVWRGSRAALLSTSLLQRSAHARGPPPGVCVEPLLRRTAAPWRPLSLCHVLVLSDNLLQESAPRLEGEVSRASCEPPPWTPPAAALPPPPSPLSRSLSVSAQPFGSF